MEQLLCTDQVFYMNGHTRFLKLKLRNVQEFSHKSTSLSDSKASVLIVQVAIHSLSYLLGVFILIVDLMPSALLWAPLA